jgi:hypothetical protein
MTLSRSRLVVLAFVAFAAVLVLYPQRDDPAVVAAAGCAAVALALSETLAETTPPDPALAAEVESRWTRLNGVLVSARRTSQGGYLDFGPSLDAERLQRDARIAAGEGTAWQAEALDRLRLCDPGPEGTT